MFWILAVAAGVVVGPRTAVECGGPVELHHGCTLLASRIPCSTGDTLYRLDDITQEWALVTTPFSIQMHTITVTHSNGIAEINSTILETVYDLETTRCGPSNVHTIPVHVADVCSGTHTSSGVYETATHPFHAFWDAPTHIQVDGTVHPRLRLDLGRGSQATTLWYGSDTQNVIGFQLDEGNRPAAATILTEYSEVAHGLPSVDGAQRLDLGLPMLYPTTNVGRGIGTPTNVTGAAEVTGVFEPWIESLLPIETRAVPDMQLARYGTDYGWPSRPATAFPGTSGMTSRCASTYRVFNDSDGTMYVNAELAYRRQREMLVERCQVGLHWVGYVYIAGVVGNWTPSGRVVLVHTGTGDVSSIEFELSGDVQTGAIVGARVGWLGTTRTAVSVCSQLSGAYTGIVENGVTVVATHVGGSCCGMDVVWDESFAEASHDTACAATSSSDIQTWFVALVSATIVLVDGTDGTTAATYVNAFENTTSMVAWVARSTASGLGVQDVSVGVLQNNVVYTGVSNGTDVVWTRLSNRLENCSRLVRTPASPLAFCIRDHIVAIDLNAGYCTDAPQPAPYPPVFGASQFDPHADLGVSCTVGLRGLAASRFRTINGGCANPAVFVNASLLEPLTILSCDNTEWYAYRHGVSALPYGADFVERSYSVVPLDNITGVYTPALRWHSDPGQFEEQYTLAAFSTTAAPTVSVAPTDPPTTPTDAPTAYPTSAAPTHEPTFVPTIDPTATHAPTAEPTLTAAPSLAPTDLPTFAPTGASWVQATPCNINEIEVTPLTLVSDRVCGAASRVRRGPGVYIDSVAYGLNRYSWDDTNSTPLAVEAKSTPFNRTGLPRDVDNITLMSYQRLMTHDQIMRVTFHVPSMHDYHPAYTMSQARHQLAGVLPVLSIPRLYAVAACVFRPFTIGDNNALCTRLGIDDSTATSAELNRIHSESQHVRTTIVVYPIIINKTWLGVPPQNTSVYCPNVAYTHPETGVCTTLRTCVPNYEYETKPATQFTDRECAMLTSCGSTSYQTIPPTATTDRTCTSLTGCVSATEYVAIGKTDIRDQGCASRTLECLHGYYYTHQQDADDGVTWYQTACTPCPAGTSSWYGDAIYSETHSNTACLDVALLSSPCTEGVTYFNAAQHIATQNTTDACRRCTVCGAAYAELSPCTLTSDTVCSSPATSGPTSTTTCQKGFYMNTKNGLNVCARCTVCVSELSACKPNGPDAICTTDPMVKVVKEIYFTVFSIIVVGISARYIIVPYATRDRKLKSH